MPPSGLLSISMILKLPFLESPACRRTTRVVADIQATCCSRASVRSRLYYAWLQVGFTQTGASYSYVACWVAQTEMSDRPQATRPLLSRFKPSKRKRATRTQPTTVGPTFNLISQCLPKTNLTGWAMCLSRFQKASTYPAAVGGGEGGGAPAGGAATAMLWVTEGPGHAAAASTFRGTGGGRIPAGQTGELSVGQTL